MNSFKVFKTPLVRPKEVADITGINYNAILKEMREGNIPYVTINGSNYIEVGKWKVTRSLCDFSTQTVQTETEQPIKNTDPMVQITVRIRESAKLELEKRAKENNVPREEVVRQMIYSALNPLKRRILDDSRTDTI